MFENLSWWLLMMSLAIVDWKIKILKMKFCEFYTRIFNNFHQSIKFSNMFCDNVFSIYQSRVWNLNLAIKFYDQIMWRYQLQFTSFTSLKKFFFFFCRKSNQFFALVLQVLLINSTEFGFIKKILSRRTIFLAARIFLLHLLLNPLTAKGSFS